MGMSIYRYQVRPQYERSFYQNESRLLQLIEQFLNVQLVRDTVQYYQNYCRPVCRCDRRYHGVPMLPT